MNRAAFNFGQGTGSALTKSPLTRQDDIQEYDRKMEEREAKLMEQGPAVPGEMEAVVVTPKMEEKRDKKKEKEAKKKAKDEKRKNKKLARIDKKRARVEFGKDSKEFKEADEWLDAHKTGQNKIKAKVGEAKDKVNETVDKIKTGVGEAKASVKGKVDKIKTKYTKSDEEKKLKAAEDLAKLKRKNPEKYAKLRTEEIASSAKSNDGSKKA